MRRKTSPVWRTFRTAAAMSLSIGATVEPTPHAQEAVTALDGVRVIVGDGRAPIKQVVLIPNMPDRGVAADYSCPHVEMADMVAAGMTPMQVIVAATRNGAELLRMDDGGTIATGKSADLLVLDGNPADDITNTRRISAVYLKGVKIDR
jgi:imidazolonepropionase-like amidohydrolase